MALIPALVVHPVAGMLTAVAWAVSARHEKRGIDTWLLAPIAVAAVVTLTHGSVGLVEVASLAGLALVAWIVSVWRWGLVRRDAGLLGIGACATAVTLALVAVASSVNTGFGQVHPGALHPNLAAGLGLALASASAAATRLPGRGGRIAATGVLSSIVYVVLTGSRGGWIGVISGLIVGGATIALRRTPLRGRRVAAAMTLALAGLLVGGLQVIAFAPAVLTARPADALVTTGTSVDPGRGATVTGRLVSLLDAWRATGGRVGTWTVARQLAAERPWLGYGFLEALPAFHTRAVGSLMVPTPHPHNGALLVLLQGGAVLLTAVMLLVIRWMWALARQAVSGDGGAAIALSAMTALLVADRFDQVIVHGNIGVMALMATLAILAQRADATASEPPPPNGPAGRP